jgi:tyrosyl-tRNA synthetase
MTRDQNEGEVERQLEAIRHGAVEFFGEDELRERLRAVLAGRRGPLRVKLGLDPSAPDLHLGHSVVLAKLRGFQELGHTPIFLVGDFTARIGDPSGRKKTRPPLTPEQIEKNAATYVEQAAQLLDVETAEIRWNGEWMDRMAPGDWVRLCSRYTVARLLERDDFAKRYAAGDPISVHEFLYPFAQAYDSVALEADVELGGTDQTFNLLMAREIQRSYGQMPQAVVTLPLLVGTDGVEKMSKSLGNHVGIHEAPEEIYGKVMSISDDLMREWYERLEVGPGDGAAGPWVALEGGDPLALKQQLAAALVARFAGAEAAPRAAEHFHRVIQRKEAPEDLPETRLEVGPDGQRGLLELLVALELVGSNSEARRLVGQGAVQLDGERVRDAALRLEPGSYLIKVGKRRFSRLALR